MSKSIGLSLLITAVLATLTAPARAETETPEPWRLSLDTDPTTYPLGGFSAWVMVKPPRSHLRFGGGGMGLSFPSFLVPVLDRGAGSDGWGLKVRAAMGFAGYQFGDHKGWYVGSYVGWLEVEHTRGDVMGTATRNDVTALPVVGYQWFPFHGDLHGVYLQPWAGAMVWIPASGSSSLGAHVYKDPYVIPLAALHVGYEF